MKRSGFGSVWFWLSMVALLVCIAYIEVMHPLLIVAVLMMVMILSLCGLSWFVGD